MMEPKWLLLSVLLLLLEGCRWYSTDACWEEERIALLQLKPFFNPQNDLNSWVDEIKGSDCCQWDRVECNTSSSSSKRVIGLFLNYIRWSKNERWYLNASLFLPFKELKHLYLPGNNIAGFVESEGFQWLSRLSNLKTLDLGDNSLKNNILFHMNGLNNLTNLKNLDLSSNRIESFQPSKQGKEMQLRMTNLEVLDLSSNLFKNDTFAFLSGLPSLESLNMGDNQLQGSIDIEDSGRQLNLTHLEEFDLSDNLINDNIFASLSGLSNLKSLDVSSNQLNGSTDMKDLGAFTNLEVLDMSFNDLNEFVACKACCVLDYLLSFCFRLLRIHITV
ncbi:receptor like protein 30-like [Durio zibethinus]|uniref:Receptor like protein 30-like n=1 Tax=Durio zibethinus TaxID=66656 RepID=A0A6P5XXB8_DURZI|nr:receptor like protein 30-like [Durio zibethinus]